MRQTIKNTFAERRFYLNNRFANMKLNFLQILSYLFVQNIITIKLQTKSDSYQLRID